MGGEAEPLVSLPMEATIYYIVSSDIYYVLLLIIDGACVLFILYVLYSSSVLYVYIHCSYIMYVFYASSVLHVCIH